jgi:predicted ATPase
VESQPEVLARHCAEAGLTEKAVGYWLKAGQQAIARGAMAEAVAQLRKGLDLLSGAPDGAQIGAAVGREFSHSLLAAVVRKPEAELQSALDRLIATGLLFRQGVPPYVSYLFKHALVP